MASTPLGEDSYPDPLLANARSSAGLWRVVVLGLILVAVAVTFSLFSDRISPDLIMTFVGILAVVGVFCLFGLAAGPPPPWGRESAENLSPPQLPPA